MTELKDEHYRVHYDEAANTVYFSGRLRDTSPGVYRQLAELLESARVHNRLAMIWDLRELDDLNSAGLSVLYYFVADQRANKDYTLRVKANGAVSWQGRFLPNLKRLMPGLQLEFSAPSSA